MAAEGTRVDAAKRFPFDQIYRAMCRHPATVRDMLRNFLAQPRGPLGAGVVDALDLRTVRGLPSEWVTRDFRSRRGDLVICVRFKAEACRRGFPPRLFLHLEHQSGPDRDMALRFLDYGGEFYRELRATEVLARNDDCPILCVLMHNGRSPWTVPTRASELVRVPPVLGQEPALTAGMAAFYPWGYHVLDLALHRDDEPIPGSVVSLMTGIEYAGRRGLAEAFTDGPLAETWRGLGSSLRRTAAMWIWRLARRHGMDVELEDLMRFEEIGKVTSRLEESIDEEIAGARAKGFEQGTAQGFEQGSAQGMERGLVQQRDLIRAQTSLRFGERTASRLAALLEGASQRELHRAGELVVQSQSEEELLDLVSEGTGNGSPAGPA